jgi:hypothetical protein
MFYGFRVKASNERQSGEHKDYGHDTCWLVIVAVLVAKLNNGNDDGGRLLQGEVAELFNLTIIERENSSIGKP